ncbi:DNA-binding protein [Hypericibacter terrae]|jgi:hemolysin III|uniref:DNA-binding protein n=1 Tax=Hypericibacter terrae TaxID=2602015 RepID=A0A5J6MJS0_9PROT|nr:hemolysin III family protein [Hypericibacter terrae]QEX16530.1 DNA-binding protein [Hypericibacter terrae]
MERPYDTAEVGADRIIHAIGVAFGLIGGALLLTVAAESASPAGLVATVLYVIGLIAMLVCSAVYNLSFASPRRELLRRMDHAAIFLMIAGTYSPFTLGRLDGAWSIWLAAVVWGGAILGAVAKLTVPRRIDRYAVVLYLALGWVVVLALEPLLASLHPAVITLIVIGGLLYTAGVVFHLWRSLRFQNAIWHALVLSAAVCHYAAVIVNLS